MEKKPEKKRSQAQNRALHLFFTQMSGKNNAIGLDQRRVFDAIRPGIDIPWTAEQYKEHFWRPIMKAATGKESTTELTTSEINKVLDILHKLYAEKFGVEIEFPSMETMIARLDNLRKKGDR